MYKKPFKKHEKPHHKPRNLLEFVLVDEVRGRMNAYSCMKLSQRQFHLPKRIQVQARHYYGVLANRTRTIENIVADYGHIDDPKSWANMVLAMNQLPNEFPADIEREAMSASTQPIPTRASRADTPYITIDGQTAKDFDDAVYARAEGDKIRIFVAIADVAFYVRPKTGLDKHARHRGNSVYMPDFVAPMLPHHLSSGVCSLKPNEERLALEVQFLMDEQGLISEPQFNQILIKSWARLTYEEVQEFYEGQKNNLKPEVIESLLQIKRAHLAYRRARNARHCMELDLPEYGIEIVDKEIKGFFTRTGKMAHQVIEDLMVATNNVVGEFLFKQGVKPVMRHHASPPAEKCEILREKLAVYDINVPVRQLTIADFQQILTRASELGVLTAVSEILLRVQAQAGYSADERGHFGLQLEYYAHFTSPIRRYADLMVHRDLYRVMGWGGGGEIPIYTAENHGLKVETCMHISQTERSAMECERAVFDRMAAYIMEPKIGDEFTGQIRTLVKNGMFVRLQGHPVDCFVDYDTLPYDIYRLTPAMTQITGKKTGLTLASNDFIQLKLIESNWLNADIQGKFLGKLD